MPPQDPNSQQPGFQPPAPAEPGFQPPAPQAPQDFQPPAPMPTPEASFPQPAPVTPDPAVQAQSFAPPAQPFAAAPAQSPAMPEQAPAFQPPAPQTFAPTQPTPPDPFAPAQPQANLPQPMIPGQPVPQAPVSPFGQPAAGSPLDVSPAAFSAPMNQPKSRKAPLIIAATAGAILLVGGIGFGITKVLGGGSITLEDYSGSAISFKYPKGYNKTEEDGLVTFKEPGDEDTASGVVAQVYTLPSYVDQSAIDQGLDTFKDKLEEELGTELTNGTKLANFKIEDTQYNGKKALKFFSKVEKSGKGVGEIKGLFGQNDHGYFIIQVVAHNSDKGVIKSEDKIIDSVKLK